MSEMIGRPLAVVTGASSGIGRGGLLFTSPIAATAPGPYHASGHLAAGGGQVR